MYNQTQGRNAMKAPLASSDTCNVTQTDKFKLTSQGISQPMTNPETIGTEMPSNKNNLYGMNYTS